MEDTITYADLFEDIAENDASKSNAENDDIDYGRIYTYTHANGETVAGTILDIRATCIGIGNLALIDAVRVAEMYDRGIALKNETETESEEESEKKENCI